MFLKTSYQMKIATSWMDINWSEAKSKMLELQYEILKAFREKDLAKVRKAQNNLVRSFAARSLAVRKVTTNQGKITPGVDGIIFDSPSQGLS